MTSERRRLDRLMMEGAFVSICRDLLGWPLYECWELLDVMDCGRVGGVSHTSPPTLATAMALVLMVLICAPCKHDHVMESPAAVWQPSESEQSALIQRVGDKPSCQVTTALPGLTCVYGPSHSPSTNPLQSACHQAVCPPGKARSKAAQLLRKAIACRSGPANSSC